ncbi:hypothetical protein GGI43DRAFT_136470 [Trichoderma evansii]
MVLSTLLLTCLRELWRYATPARAVPSQCCQCALQTLLVSRRFKVPAGFRLSSAQVPTWRVHQEPLICPPAVRHRRPLERLGVSNRSSMAGSAAADTKKGPGRCMLVH